MLSSDLTDPTGLDADLDGIAFESNRAPHDRASVALT